MRCNARVAFCLLLSDRKKWGPWLNGQFWREADIRKLPMAGKCIANPDLAHRLAIDAPPNPYDRSTFHGGAGKGYVDHPALETEQA